MEGWMDGWAETSAGEEENGVDMTRVDLQNTLPEVDGRVDCFLPVDACAARAVRVKSSCRQRRDAGGDSLMHRDAGMHHVVAGKPLTATSI
jgi:hypothetical protein